MRKLLYIGTLLLVILSCREKTQETVSEDTSDYELSTEEWPKKFMVNSTASKILNEWPEFNALEVSYDALYNIANRDDLSLNIENIIEGLKLLEDSEYPEQFNKPQIKSRQKVFKTYVLKVKGDLIYRLDPQESVLEMINAFNSLRKQFNVIVNNTLDTKLILDE
ncbi:MAG: hypothetical protein WBM53_09885 [Maribacter sp.]